MVTFVLILWFKTGAFHDGNNMSAVQVPGFESLAECSTAGSAAALMASGSYSDIKFVCVRQTHTHN